MATYKMTFKTQYGSQQTRTVFADSVEEARSQAPAGVTVVSIEESHRDSTKFDSSIFRKEFRENVKRLDEDSIAEYHAKIARGEIVLDPPAPAPKPEPEEVLLDGSSKPGDLLKYRGTWYVSIESYETSIDEGESYSYGHETRARKATDTEIAAYQARITTPSPTKPRQSERAKFLAEHGVPEGRDPKLYLTDKNLRRLAELSD